MSEINYRGLQDDLAEGFIRMEYTKRNPLQPYNHALALEMYRSDTIFHASVNSMVSSIVTIVQKHDTGV